MVAVSIKLHLWIIRKGLYGMEINLKSDYGRRFLNVRELANYLSVSEETIRSWIKRGQIPYSKLGRSVRFDIYKVELWLKNRECAYIKRIFAENSL